MFSPRTVSRQLSPFQLKFLDSVLVISHPHLSIPTSDYRQSIQIFITSYEDWPTRDIIATFWLV